MVLLLVNLNLISIHGNGGIISAKGRDLDKDSTSKLIQTDAARILQFGGALLVNTMWRLNRKLTWPFNSTVSYNGYFSPFLPNNARKVTRILMEYAWKWKGMLGILVGTSMDDSVTEMDLLLRDYVMKCSKIVA
jgi:hypothetical protein